MLSKLDKTEKIILAVGVGVVVILTGLVVIFFDDIGVWLGLSEEELTVGSMGDDLGLDLGVSLVSVEVVDDGNGKVGIWLNLEEPVPLLGAELHFEVKGELVVNQVGCGEGFACGVAEYKDGVVKIVALRPLLESEEDLDGNIMIAEISYQEGTQGTLVINSEKIGKSEVAATGYKDNLIPTLEESFNVGY